jgi:multiple sugar transport system ATP-binding protein
VILGIRPEAFEDARFDQGAASLEVVPVVVEELGSETHVFFHADAPPVTAEGLERDDEGTLLPDSKALFAARLDPRTAARVGSPIELALNNAGLHFFDPETGSSLLQETEAELAPHGELAATP